MAGKSNKGKSKGKGKPESGSVASKEVQPLTSATGLPELVLKKAPAVPAAVEQLAVEAPKEVVAEALAESPKVETPASVSEKMEGTDVSDDAKSKPEEAEPRDVNGDGEADGDAELPLYPITVKGPGGEQLELQVNPGDSVMDLRQFLLDAPETCFYTCYDLILSSADGVRYHLAEYLEIGEVADISAGGCSLEMINALYDDRMVRSHVRRTRDLLFTASIHSSLSTALAMEYEAKQAGAAGEDKSTKDKSASKDKAGSVKTELAELEGGLGFMEDSCGQLSSLITLPEPQDKPCVETIAFSSFNPVPGYRRLLGDLIYLDVVTAEGKNFCITAHTHRFYVNCSKGNILNAEPATPAVESTTLVGLLRLLSKKFASGFAEILDKKSAGHPFENVPVLLPPNAWLGPHPTPPHKRDIARAEDALMVPYGTEVVGMQRDWNEELQSCREFSRENLQDRIMRDRALYKVNCDFVEAATKGAKAVINRCIPPINPTDPDRFHMYVHNNIFFSFAVDGDFTLMQQMRDQNLHTNETATEKQTSANGDVQPDTVEKSESDASLNADANAAAAAVESEQATYASANNDLKGTKAYNNVDVSGLYTLAMAIIDYRGHRVVAQSIIPGILQGDKTESLLYGSVDNGKKIAWNEKFHAKALEAGKLLHIKEHTVLDGAGKSVTICAPVECKGIVGSDDRHYLLDLMRTTPRDINYTGPGSRLCVLRPELVAAFCQVEALERVKMSKTDEDQADEKALVQEELSKIMLNPNVFTDFKIAGSQEEIEADEELVRKAGNYLKDTVLPKLVSDLSSLEVSPMDGPTLTDALHAHGINIRYLGQVAKKAEHLPHVWDLTVVEMVVRAAKHVLKGVLRETLDQDVGGAIAHFFNCLVGPESLKSSVEGSSGSSGKSEAKSSSGKASSTDSVTSETKPSYLCITPDLVWSDIEESVKFKFQFDLPNDVRSRIRKISTLRNLSQKMGVMLAARKYEFEADSPFKTSDILDLQSVVKHLSPVCVDARDLLESGKLRLAQGKLNEAYEAFSEAFTILQQVCGPMHREVANCCRYLAMVLYHAGDMAGAIMQQHKELIINERCLGSDHPDTAHSYGNMALFYHGLNQTELALRHMARTLVLLNVSCGSDHPDVAATFINIAMMYQDIGKMNVALRYLQEALKRNERLLGQEHIQTAVCYHALAIAFNCMGAYKLSLQHEQSTYNILLKQLGEEDSRTKDSANWIKTFQIRDIQAHAQKQKGQQAISAATAQKAAADALKARPDLVQAFQQAAASSNINRGGPIGRSPDMQRARGAPDERAARAANEVRKKAAARGLNVRPQAAAPNQSIPPLGDLLSLINSGVAGKAPLASSTPSSSTPRGTAKAALKPERKTASAAARPGPVSAVRNGPVQATADLSSPSPVGLGNGLGGLEKKKKKSQSKVLLDD